MPQITNTTNADIWFPQIGETVPANSFINTDLFPIQDANSGVTSSVTWIPTGLIINNSIQNMDPIILSQACSANTTITLPSSVLPRTSYRVKIYCSSGPVGVRFNSTSNTLFSIAANDYFEIVCQSRTINQIFIYISTLGFGAGTCYVLVRKA